MNLIVYVFEISVMLLNCRVGRNVWLLSYAELLGDNSVIYFKFFIICDSLLCCQ